MEGAVRVVTDVIKDASDEAGKAKTQYALWNRWFWFLGIPDVLIAAASGVTALSSITVLAAILAFTSAALSAVIAFAKPEARAALHNARYSASSAIARHASNYLEVGMPQNVLGTHNRLRLDQLDKVRNAVDGLQTELRLVIDATDAGAVYGRERSPITIPVAAEVGQDQSAALVENMPIPPTGLVPNPDTV